MSFAVDKQGVTEAWGQNKHNALLINTKDQNGKEISVNSTFMPMKVQYPDYFERPLNNNIVVNNLNGVIMYEAKRPVKSVASETQQELDKAKTELYKQKILVKELEKKIAKQGAQEIDDEMDIN